MVYLDYNATTPLEKSVLDAIQDALQHAWGNPSSKYEHGIAAKNIIDEARSNVAKMIGAKSSDIVFMSGGTEANNTVIWTAIQNFKKCCENQNYKKPHIISSDIEHDTIKKVLQHFEEHNEVEVTYVSAAKLKGKVDVEDVLAALRPSTCLVTIMMANNETGVIQPISEIGEKIAALNKLKGNKQLKIFFHTDAAQAIGKIKVDVESLNVDYLTIVGHKFYGPRIGALFIKEPEVKTPLYPMLYGGSQENDYRPGTENTGMIAGLGKAAELVVTNLHEYSHHMKDIRSYLEESLKMEFKEMVQFNGTDDADSHRRLPNTCNVSVLQNNIDGRKILLHCKILHASVGAACHSHLGNRASAILLASGVDESAAKAAIRLSVGRHTTKKDIDVVMGDLKNSINLILGS